MVDVVAETRDEESKNFEVGEDGETATVLEESVAEVSHGECVGPVVVRRVTVTLLHHQYKPVGGGGGGAESIYSGWAWYGWSL